MRQIIAIDPDLSKSGVSVFNENGLVYCNCLDLEDLFIFLNGRVNSLILLEAGHLIKNCWHKGGRGAASNTGKGKAVGVILERFLIKHKFDFKLLKPHGYSNYFDNEAFFKLQTKWEGRTNKDARASAALGFLNK
jgi:hypothetical protein